MTDDDIIDTKVVVAPYYTCSRAELIDEIERLRAEVKTAREEERERCDKIIEEMQGDMPAMLVDMRLVALMFNALRHRVAEND